MKKLPTNHTALVEEALRRDFSQAPMLVIHHDDALESIRDLLDHEQAKIAIVDRQVVTDQIEYAESRQAFPANNLYVQTSNANLGGGTITQDEWLPNNKGLMGNIILVSGIRLSPDLADKGVVVDYLRKNISTLLSTSQFDIQFSARGFAKNIFGLGPGEKLEMTELENGKFQQKTSKQISSTIQIMEKQMKPIDNRL